MKILEKAWIIFLFASFAASVLALSAVQIRLIRKEGFGVFFRRSLLDLYWRELRPFQRALKWTGILAFMITMLVAPILALLKST